MGNISSMAAKMNCLFLRIFYLNLASSKKAILIKNAMGGRIAAFYLRSGKVKSFLYFY